ncbi:MAG TPA: hypothetical protein VK335_30550 [Bryobacteraceae bacterium]|nr:hypothetical protein [Bryobacteraceae bacterium]HZW94748.1 hypothetical protein [Candidatus Eremiobacteraceae bacterium]
MPDYYSFMADSVLISFPNERKELKEVFVIALRSSERVAYLPAEIAQHANNEVKYGFIISHFVPKLWCRNGIRPEWQHQPDLIGAGPDLIPAASSRTNILRSSISHWLSATLLAILFWPALAVSQNVDSNLTAPSESAKSAETSPSADVVQQPSKHVLWVIPNFRTSPPLEEYSPINPEEKFKLAAEDSFDRGTVALAAAFAGEAQMTNATKSFGQGVAGYSRYFGTAYADFVIGNYMTEGIFPTILHQDPRYFPKLSGSGWSRLAYAVGQIFWTHKDSGGMQFNFSEWVGNSTAVAISEAYYPDNRTAGNAISKLETQIAVDMAANIVKEFWPDFQRKLSRKHKVSIADR